MAKKAEEKEEQKEPEKVGKKAPETLVELADFKIECLEDFEIYNKGARILRRPIKVPDESYHKKIKVRFNRFDQPENILKAMVRNKDIEWTGQLKPGCIYTLPVPVINFLNSRAVPIYAQVDVKNEGGDTLKETRQVGERARFSCQPLEL